MGIYSESALIKKVLVLALLGELGKKYMSFPSIHAFIIVRDPRG